MPLSTQSESVAASSPAKPLSVLPGRGVAFSPMVPLSMQSCGAAASSPYPCQLRGCWSFYFCDSECLGYDFHCQFQPRDSDLVSGTIWSLISLALRGICLSVFVTDGLKAPWCPTPPVCYEFPWRLETEKASTICINITETWNVSLCFLMFCFLPRSQHPVRLGGFSCSEAKNACN